MTESKSNLENLSKEQLITIIEDKRRRNEELESTLTVYQKHIERVIGYHSVESYRETLRRNKKKRSN